MREIRPPDIDGLPPGEAARVLAEAGWKVGPLWPLVRGHCSCDQASACLRPGDHPIDKPGFCPRGVADFTTDIATITRWWAAYPDADIGMLPPTDPGEVLAVTVPREERKKRRLS